MSKVPWKCPVDVQRWLAYFGNDVPVEWTMRMNSLPLQAFHLLAAVFQLLLGMYVLVVGARQLEGTALLCNCFVRIVGMMIVRQVQDYKMQSNIHMVLFLFTHALNAYSSILPQDDIYRYRALAMNFISWKVYPALFVFPRVLSNWFLILSGATEVIALILADSIHGTSTPARVYVTLFVYSICFQPLHEMSRGRFRMLYEAQQQLMVEASLLQKMLAMLCDGSITLGQDANTILNSNQGFDYLMGRSMEGESLMKYIPESKKDQERERVRHAFGRAQAEPVLIPTTLTSNVMGAQNMELFIVYQGSTRKLKDPEQQARYLVGIRKASQCERSADDDFQIDEPLGWHANAQNNESEPHMKKNQTVQEKVLRCEAEFKQEQILHGALRKELKNLIRGGCATKSAVSAPTVVQQPAQICSVNQTFCSGNSCLPDVAEVWKEGHSVPTSIMEVAPGDRVLCLDEWAGTVGYIPVTAVHISDAHQTSWLMVILEDGSTQQMTADHPVYPHAHGQPCQCSRACDLKPGYHTLPVLKLVHVPVQAVEHVEADPERTHVDIHPKKASLSVTDSRRYTVLTRCGPEHGSQSGMAVGAVTLPGENNVVCHNSFLHVVNGEPRDLRRCSSEPALHVAATQNASVVSSTLSNALSSKLSSTLSSGSATILMWDEDICKTSFVAALYAKNLPSAGSRMHESPSCKPCLFQGRLGKQWAPCWKGALCEYCHINTAHSKRQYTKRSLRL